MLQNGKLTDGDRILSENELVGLLNISRASVREGLRALQALDLLESHQGSGRFVKRPTSSGVIRRELLPMLMMSEAVHEVQDVRVLLEGEIAARAARRAKPEDLSRLRSLIGQAAASARSGKDIHKYTWDFHNVLAELGGNPVMSKVLLVMQELIAEGQATLYQPYVSPVAGVAAHRRLLNAVATGDPRVARHAMTEHLEKVDQVVTHAVAKRKSSNRPGRPAARAATPRGGQKGTRPGA
jgi:GntR family transcriptional repressor for pyruvate dehydrogenase complex